MRALVGGEAFHLALPAFGDGRPIPRARQQIAAAMGMFGGVKLWQTRLFIHADGAPGSSICPLPQPLPAHQSTWAGRGGSGRRWRKQPAGRVRHQIAPFGPLHPRWSNLGLNQPVPARRLDGSLQFGRPIGHTSGRRQDRGDKVGRAMQPAIRLHAQMRGRQVNQVWNIDASARQHYFDFGPDATKSSA